jgi:hypothetical protein
MKEDTKYLIAAIPTLVMFSTAFFFPALAATVAISYWAARFSTATTMIVVMVTIILLVLAYHKGINWLRKHRHHGSS